jgi:enterochelin esterase family protein
VSFGADDAGTGSDLRRLRWAHLWPAGKGEGPAGEGEHAVVDTSSSLAAVGSLLAPGGSRPEDPLPLLLVHDGPEYAQLAALPRYLRVLSAREPALRCRVLLLRPVDRDRSYSASPGYARALAEGLLPEVRASVAVRGPLVGVGASLGGLAMTHLALTRPGSLGGVLVQSGSFFAPDTDSMELGYRFFDRVADFVAGLDADPARLRGLRIALTCGTGEENLVNNRRTQRRLLAAGVPTTLTENPDGHTYTGWRDSLDPALADLLRAVWAPSHQRDRPLGFGVDQAAHPDG